MNISCYTIAILIILMLFIHKSIHLFYEQYGIDNGYRNERSKQDLLQ